MALNTGKHYKSARQHRMTADHPAGTLFPVPAGRPGSSTAHGRYGAIGAAPTNVPTTSLRDGRSAAADKSEAKSTFCLHLTTTGNWLPIRRASLNYSPGRVTRPE